MIYAPFQFDNEQHLAGRGREIEFFNAMLDRTLTGHGALVLLGGEAGIGKTSIVHCVEQYAENAEMCVLIGSCRDAPDQPPFGPWIDATRMDDSPPAIAQLASLLSNRTAQPDVTEASELYKAAAQCLLNAARDRAMLVVLEDLHWAERTTLDLLRVVSRELRNVPLLIVATYRNDELTRDDELYRVLPALVRESQAARIDLPRLDDAATRSIVRRHYDMHDHDLTMLTQVIFDRAHGNPLHTIELLLALEGSGHIYRIDGRWRVEATLFESASLPVPPLIRQVIESRLSNLDQEPRHLLNVAAVAGEQFDLDLWHAMSGMDEPAFTSACAQALQVHVIDEIAGKNELQFRHALTRETLYTAIPLPERQQLHLAAAEYLSRHNADPDRVADHFALANDIRAVGWLTRSGHRWLQIYAPEPAIARLSRAIEIDSQSRQPSAEPYLRRGEALATVGQSDAAIADVTRALELAREAGDRKMEWQALATLGDQWAGRNYSRTRAYHDLALHLAREIDDPERIALSLNRLSNWHLNNNDPVRAITDAEEALKTFQALGDLAGESATTRLLAMEYLVRGDLLSSDRAFRSAIQYHRSRDERHSLCSALTGLIYTSGTYTFHTEVPGPLTSSEVALAGEEALAISRDTHWRAGEAYVHLALASQQGIRGRYQEALENATAGLDIAVEIDHREWMALGHQIIGRLHLDLFSLDSAEEHLLTSRELAESARAPLHRRLASAYLAHVAISRGLPEAAETLLGPRPALDSPPATVIGRKTWATWAGVLLSAGEPAQALELVDRLIDTTLNASADYVVPFHGRLRGEALTALGRFEDAEQSLERSLSSARTSGFQAVEWRVMTALARLCKACGNESGASAWATSARSLATGLASRVPAGGLYDSFMNQVEARLPVPRQLTALQAAKHEFGGLTARQRDVAGLIGQGASNAEIADALSISERTAESHVAAILKTLGFSSRAQVAGWAIQRGLAGEQTS